MTIFIKKLFASRRQKKYLKAIEISLTLIDQKIETLRPKYTATLAHALVPGQIQKIKQGLTNFILNRHHSNDDEDITENQALIRVLTMIVNKCREWFDSDSEDIYRFGLSSDGQALRLIFKASMDILVSIDKTTEEDIKQLKLSMRDRLGNL